MRVVCGLGKRGGRKGGDGGDVRYRELEGINSVTVAFIQRPPDMLIQCLHRYPRLLRHMSHYRRDHLAFVVALFALHDVFGRYTTFGEIDVACASLSAPDLFFFPYVSS